MKVYLIFISMLLGGLHLSAQKNKADEHFRLDEYNEAIPLYAKYMQSNATDYLAVKNLGVCYKLTNSISKASDTYKTIVSLKESTVDDLFQLVQLLRIQQNITEAKPYALKYKNMAPGEKADNLLLSLDRYNSFMESKDDYTLTNKTPAYLTSVCGVVKYGNQFLVTAENSQSNTSTWTGRGNTDLFTTDNSFVKLTPFAKEVMIDGDDATPTFTDNGNTMYYTSIHKDFIQEGDINNHRLKVAIATFNGKKWIPGSEFPYNSLQYQTAHPTISSDGSLLVFTSDMPGGKGGMDLYLCKKQNNTWTQPQNLTLLNTSENEIFPVFNNDGDLLFSSSGLPGLGGLDLFTAKKNSVNFDAPINLKAPFNSSYDDFFLFSDNNLASGYLSSNRYDDPQIDHVIYFEKKLASGPVTPVAPIISGTPNSIGLVVNVLDKYTRTPLPYVSVTIKDKTGQVFHKGLTDPNGRIELEELPKGEYTIQGMINDVSTTIAKVTEADFNSNTTITKEVLHNDPRFTLVGVAINTKTTVPLPGVLITCTNVTSGAVQKTITAADGKFFFQLEQNSDFEVQGQKKGWLSSETAEKTTKGLDRSQQLYVNLQLNIEQPVTGGTIELKKIHYDYDKWNIRPDAATELNRLVKLMNDYPDMVIELSSHTDSRGSDEYNRILSQHRAESAVSYLIQEGIQKKRLNAMGYGESRLVNGCSNGVTCTDALHEENRRTEFTIQACGSCPKH